ncbi:Mariner Mos1 transposase [Halotydeus destructor]|nr:Mariner Mos1 transposase [Halotydeus destructor]
MKRFVPLKLPQRLTDSHNKSRFIACSRNIKATDQDPSLISRLVVSDEHILPVRSKRNSKPTYVTVIPFFDSQGLIYSHVTKAGVNVNSQYYDWLLREFRQKYDQSRDVTLYPLPLLIDNATFHTTPSVKQTVKFLNMKRISHPSYSPDLNPCDFYLFKVLNDRLRAKGSSGDLSGRIVQKEVRSILSPEVTRALMKELHLRWFMVCLLHVRHLGHLDDELLSGPKK